MKEICKVQISYYIQMTDKHIKKNIQALKNFYLKQGLINIDTIQLQLYRKMAQLLNKLIIGWIDKQIDNYLVQVVVLEGLEGVGYTLQLKDYDR